MESMSWLVAGLFLPLFPLGMVFNALFQKLRVFWIRSLLLIVWPLPGIWILHSASFEVPNWLLTWALFSAILYGFRAVVVREFGVWTGFLATSAWVLAWPALSVGFSMQELVMHVEAFSLPLALLTFLTSQIEQRYESAYAGIVSGIAQVHPRLSGLLIVTMLAVIGSPLFPGFFSMISSITHAVSVIPYAAMALTLVWLLWSWSGVRLLQEILVGPAVQTATKDIGPVVVMTSGMLLLALVIAGLYLSGVVL